MAIEGITSVTEKDPPDYFPMPFAPNKGKAADKAGKDGLTPEETQEVADLKLRDAEVRRHEQAHLVAAGAFAKGGAAYEYELGPDGKRYAIGGEVEIDTAPIADDPAATITKAQTIRKAALAPADPSGQDRAVASQATRMESQARQALAEQEKEKAQGYNPQGQPANATSPPKLLNEMV